MYARTPPNIVDECTPMFAMFAIETWYAMTHTIITPRAPPAPGGPRGRECR
jgi:hypothetical protein